MLAVLFYVMITPGVALLFRWRGRDSLHRAPAQKSQPEDLRRYFWQY
jgi:hypothetical protein